MLHAISNVKHVSLTGLWYTAYCFSRMGYRMLNKIQGSKGSIGWILGYTNVSVGDSKWLSTMLNNISYVQSVSVTGLWSSCGSVLLIF